jgi:hypothetical protein
MNQIETGLVIWVFMLLFGYRYRNEPVIRILAGLLGVIVGLLILEAPWTLIGLVVIGLNLYVVYGALVEWK